MPLMNQGAEFLEKSADDYAQTSSPPPMFVQRHGEQQGDPEQP